MENPANWSWLSVCRQPALERACAPATPVVINAMEEDHARARARSLPLLRIKYLNADDDNHDKARDHQDAVGS